MVILLLVVLSELHNLMGSTHHPNLKLVIEPSLSIVAFERVGWSSDDYEKWSDKLLADQIGFVTP